MAQGLDSADVAVPPLQASASAALCKDHCVCVQVLQPPVQVVDPHASHGLLLVAAIAAAD